MFNCQNWPKSTKIGKTGQNWENWTKLGKLVKIGKIDQNWENLSKSAKIGQNRSKSVNKWYNKSNIQGALNNHELIDQLCCFVM